MFLLSAIGAVVRRMAVSHAMRSWAAASLLLLPPRSCMVHHTRNSYYIVYPHRRCPTLADVVLLHHPHPRDTPGKEASPY